MESNNNEINRKIKIRNLTKPGEIKEIKISEIDANIKKRGSFNYKESIVSYIDILGFSNKKKLIDIESTLFDFSSPLAVASKNAPDINFYIFSDCAFIVSHID